MSKANHTSETEQMPAFETSLKELEQIVIRLESGDLPLEDALNEFERGIQLARQGQKTLQQAEQRVQILLNHDAQSPLDEFPPNAE
ncbi:exodeoxyribonuclease VII small subunit [Xenorhabdus sp. XENO-10]|uniref:Exodeoxyribonuclease 7 small subunit n=1 Tax=Xenorhabdus yunnanensis TaxID=3025878 RepID=A0ABT5L9Z5_9GAMM|nr:exodeoxyribonuclease VII small subunit [Xenorhabdus yunnanensis]MDC9587822.1 exodeoxyribonuclease VII small subunit [Xenorhabdus yunnanensis]